VSFQSESLTQANVAANAATVQEGSKASNLAGRARLFFADNLRVALTILVVVHHVAVVYAANAAFYYVEPPDAKDLLAYLPLVVFELFNQAYFMGFFFLLSGYFTPNSFDRKGPGSFFKDRLLRLGIPLLVFIFVLNPISCLGLFWMPASLTGITVSLSWQTFWQMYPQALGVGPLWFVEMLLFFDLGYVLWRRLTKNQAVNRAREIKVPGYPVIGLFILLLAVASYLIRIVVPLGMAIPVLGFPTFAYFPEYLSFFIVGLIAVRNDWLRTIPGSMGKVGFGVALVATIVLFPLALSTKTAFLGHGSWSSAVYALWDSTFAVGMCLGLITLFRRFFNREGRFGRFLSQQAFTVYIIHIPVIVFLAIVLRDIHPQQLLKFALVAVIAVPLSFGVAWLVRKIPFASRIL